jgi:hypothetical protein
MDPNPEMLQSTREVPKEEVTVRSSGALKKRHRDRHLAARCHGKPKELTQGDCRSQRKLAAAYRKVSRHATLAWRRRNIIRNNWTRDKVEQGTQGVGSLRKSLRMHHEGRMGTGDLGGRWPLYLRKEKATTNSIGGWG